MRDLKKALPAIFTSLEAAKGKDFSNTRDTINNNIIKFKIRSDLEDSSENQTGSVDAVGKFDYNKQLDADKKYNQDDYTKEKEQEKILELLKKASMDTITKFSGANLSDDFFIAVMKVASENSGIANIDAKAFEEALEKLNPPIETKQYAHNLKEGETLHKIAKYFSAQFQDLSKKDNYFTARKTLDGNFNDTGRRLFRVCTEENIEAFQNTQNLDRERDEASDSIKRKLSFEATRSLGDRPHSSPTSPSATSVLKEDFARASSSPT